MKRQASEDCFGEPPRSKRKMIYSPNAVPVITDVLNLSFSKHIYAESPYHNKEKGFKLVKLKVSKVNGNPPRILFRRGGEIPGFGIDHTQHLKTYLKFTIGEEAERNAIMNFEKEAIMYARSQKEEWWPNQNITDSQIGDNFMSILTPGKEKKDGSGSWPASLKVHVPTSNSTDCQIVDSSNCIVDLEQLPNKSWACAVVEFPTIYFQNKCGWGFGPKTIRLLQCAPDVDGVPLPGEIDYLSLVKENDVPEEQNDTSS